MSKAQTKGPLQRVGGVELAVAVKVLKAATRYILPEDMTQRQAFAIYLPELYVLRNKGCSFAQITTLLVECGVNLQPSTVRGYYSEMLADRLDECQRRMNEQILLMAEVRKVTVAVDPFTMAEKLTGINDRQRALAMEKIERLFGMREHQITALPQTAVHEPTKPEWATPNPKPLNNPILDDEPVVPNLTASGQSTIETNHPLPVEPAPQKPLVASPSPQTPDQPRNLRCMALQSGVKPLPQKPHVPAEVYSPGDLEHPAIPGLILNLQQRLSSLSLHYLETDTGETHVESLHEKRFRIFWQKPIPMTPSSSSDSFVKMDMSLFA
jgi:hypothetical protein